MATVLLVPAAILAGIAGTGGFGRGEPVITTTLAEGFGWDTYVTGHAEFR